MVCRLHVRSITYADFFGLVSARYLLFEERAGDQAKGHSSGVMQAGQTKGAGASGAEKRAALVLRGGCEYAIEIETQQPPYTIFLIDEHVCAAAAATDLQ
ncbi:MAG: hypothetical protein WCI73_07475 [Phycisphaerae bacterium]